MSDQLPEPAEKDNIDCHLQQIGMGSLVCRATKQVGDHSTNEVDPAICFNCPAGKVYREIGCDAVQIQNRVHSHMKGQSVSYGELFCKLRKRPTTLEYCKTCDLVVAPTTKQTVSQARGLFRDEEFFSAYKDIEKARESMRDGNFENAITRSIACLESIMRTCHDKMGEDLPKKKQVSDLWKSTRSILAFDDLGGSGQVAAVMNSLSGLVTQLGGLRNAMGDAHGRGVSPPIVSESIAELAINTASTMATLILRRYRQVRADNE